MTSDTDIHFYKELPSIKRSIANLLTDRSQFKSVPKHWHVIITDIRNSTAAVDRGDHQLVNLLATGSIIAVLNIAQKFGTEIPFFFGGDGATLLVPNLLLDPCLSALSEHQRNARVNFDFDLRVGHVPISSIDHHLFDIKIAKLTLTKFLAIPIVLGKGLAFAETQVKARENQIDLHLTESSTLDLTGMECRWDKIQPPKNPGEVVALLVDVADSDRQPKVFAEVLTSIEDIYGPIQTRNPISRDRLRIKASLSNIKREMKAKIGKMDLLYLLKNWIFTFVGKLYYGKTKETRRYLDSLVQLSDTLTIDGRINTVISGSTRQRERLIKRLERLETAGDLIFGWFASPESVMSCYVRNRTDQHIHFVDGSEGGYTQAAKMLKKKLKKSIRS